MFTLRMSVRSLVEFVYQSGDIDHRFLSVERAQEGSRIHRLLQRTSPDPYEAEVYFKHQQIYHDICFEIEGRADGIIKKNGRIIIDEIKTVHVPLSEIEIDYRDVHWAQAMCYAYFYLLEQNELNSILVQLTYFQVDEETIKQFQKELTRADLTAFYEKLLHDYSKWGELQKEHEERRNESIQKLVFPFPAYRDGQRRLAVAVYKTILDKDVLFVQAPTGIGKTMSTLFPSIKAIGESKVERVFYLTAKSITRSVAWQALALMKQKQVYLHSITLTAKDKMCFLKERNCDPEICPYAKGYYDRVKEVMYQVLIQHDMIGEDILKEYGRNYQVCPFELSLDLSLYCDVIVCDYNYVFDPQVFLKRYFMEPGGKHMFLIDEAHNLVDRARSMFSASLSKSSFKKVRKQLPTSQKKLRQALQKVTKGMDTLIEADEARSFLIVKEPFLGLNKLLQQFQKICEPVLAENAKSAYEEDLRQLYFDSNAYLRISELYDEHYVMTINRTSSDITVTQFCIDPSLLVKGTLKKGTAACLFSATMTPLPYFLSLLGGDEDTKRLMLYSPFPKENLSVFIHDGISTRYRQRASSIQPIVKLIHTATAPRSGNYIVYAPSYQYLHQIAQAFQNAYPEVTVRVQHSDMSDEERVSFLQAFDEEADQTMIGFCVLGGMYGEGIDLRGDALIGTIIIGVGLPQINEEQNIFRDYFEEQNQMGYEYAYVFPGMNKVLQAAGRVIRTETDRGFILLIDDRYTTAQYRQLLPPHWDHYTIIHQEQDLKAALDSFWNK